MDDIDVLSAPYFTELRRTVESFASCDGQAGVLSDGFESGNVSGANWLFDPSDVVSLDMPCDFACLMWCEPSVHLDHDLGTGTGYRGYRFDQVKRFEEFIAFEFKIAIAERIELHRSIPAVDDALSGGGELLRGAFDGVPPVCVCLDAVCDLPTEELVNGLVAGFTDNVPECEFDEGESSVDDLSSFSEVQQRHSPEQGFDIEGVVSDEVSLSVSEIFAYGVRLAQDSGFADAGDAFVGFDDAVCEISPRSAEHYRPEASCLHLWACQFVICRLNRFYK